MPYVRNAVYTATGLVVVLEKLLCIICLTGCTFSWLSENNTAISAAAHTAELQGIRQSTFPHIISNGFMFPCATKSACWKGREYFRF